MYKPEDLVKILRDKPSTAREVAVVLKCCTPTAYKRIKALSALGYNVVSFTTHDVKPGPVAALYSID